MNAHRPGHLPATLLALATATILWSVGCAVQSDGPLIAPPLPALAAEQDPVQRSADASLEGGFDRSGWRTTTIQIPAASVAHQPTYVSRTTPPTSTPVTAVQALEVSDAGSRTACADLADLVAIPGEAALDLLLAPIRMVVAPPWTTVSGPRPDPGLLPHAAHGEAPRREGGS